MTTAIHADLGDFHTSIAQVLGLQPHDPMDERIAMNKHRRQEVPQAAHAKWTPPPDRPDPVQIIRAQVKHCGCRPLTKSPVDPERPVAVSMA